MKIIFIFFLIIFTSCTNQGFAMQMQGCGQDCASCHVLSKEEAGKLLKADKVNAQIQNVKISPIKGLWEVEAVKNGRYVSVYIDFSKKYLVEAIFTPLDQLSEDIKPQKVDTSMIPLDGSIVMGNPKAKNKIIVFTDPDCPYCKKFHYEIKNILKERKDIVFYIKLLPLTIHPQAYNKSKAIICSKHPNDTLDKNFMGGVLNNNICDTNQIDQNIVLAQKLGINGTPTIIMPDGELIFGSASKDKIFTMLDQNTEVK